MRGNDLIFAFPALLLAILITAVFGPGAVNAIIAIGIFNIPVFARVTRAGALQQWTRDYTLAARVAGKGPLRISWEHILPNLARPVGRAGHDSVFAGRHRGGGPVVRGLERATADSQLGPHAQRGANPDRAGALPGAFPGNRGAAVRTGTESARRGIAPPSGRLRMSASPAASGSDRPERGHRCGTRSQKRVARSARRRNPRPGRRIGVGQIDDGARHHAAVAAERSPAPGSRA